MKRNKDLRAAQAEYGEDKDFAERITADDDRKYRIARRKDHGKEDGRDHIYRNKGTVGYGGDGKNACSPRP